MQYVGKTVSPLASRWSQHKYYAKIGSNGFLHRAISKYGPEVFTVEQIDSASSLKGLNEKEIFHIARLNTLAPNGYNLTIGGEGAEMTADVRAKLAQACTGWKHTEEAKRKISQNHRQNYQAMPKEVAQKISATLSGRILSEETKKKISLGSFNKKKVECSNGHPYDAVNTYIRKDGGRACLICTYLSNGQKLPEKLRQYARE